MSIEPAGLPGTGVTGSPLFLVPHFRQSGPFEQIGIDIGRVVGSVKDIFKDLESIREGVMRIQKGFDDIQEGAEKITQGMAGFAFSPIGGAVLILEGGAQMAWGGLEVIYGTFKVLWYIAQLVWDVGRLIWNVFKTGFDIARLPVHYFIAFVKAVVGGGPGSGIMSLLDPMRWGRAINEAALGIEKFLRVNDYVRAPGFEGKGIVRETVTIPFVGQASVVKLNRGHIYKVFASADLTLLGHVYNIVRF